MEKAISKLKDLISSQIQLLGIIKEVEKEKNELLSSGRLTDFSGINENLGHLIAENNKLEEKRAELLAHIASGYHRDVADMSFPVLIEKIEDKKLKESFSELYEKLKALVNEIKELSQINKELIETAIQVIDISLEGEGVSESGIDYTRKLEGSSDKPLLINKII